MKFLLFNLAVAAALVFLFSVERGEVQNMAGEVHDAATDIKDYANKAFNTGQEVLDRGKVKAVRKSIPRDPQPSRSVSQQARTRATTPPGPRSEPAAVKPSEPPTELPLSPQLARNLPPMPETGLDTGKTSLADLNPAVAKRRKEVLDGIEMADAALVLKEGTRLMTPAERRRELLLLADEMELLYVRSISQ